MKSTGVNVVAWLWPPILVALAVAAAVVDSKDGWPVLGAVLIVVVGIGGLLGIAWLRQRPIAPGDDDNYRTTAYGKLAIVEAVGLAGVVLAIAVGPWWLAVIGACFSIAGLSLSWPSPADQERHELLYLV